MAAIATYWRIRDEAVDRGLRQVANVMSSIGATARSRRYVAVSRDRDGDWRHRWGRDHFLFSGVSWTQPAAHIAYHHPTFLHRYRPTAGDVVVDCGAGVGTEVRLFSDLVGPSGRVVAVEPDAAAFRRLSKLVRSLPLANVTPVHAAVSDREGHGSLQRGADVDAVQAVLRPPLADAPPVVRVRRLDLLLDELGIGRVDLLKVNVEGHEAQVLRGLGKHSADVRHMCVSCHDFLGSDSRTYDGVVGILADEGFDIARADHDVPTDAAAWYVYAAAPGDTIGAWPSELSSSTTSPESPTREPAPSGSTESTMRST